VKFAPVVTMESADHFLMSEESGDLGVAGGCVFPGIYFASGKINVGRGGDLGTQVERRAGVERLVAAVIHARHPGAGGDDDVIEKVCQAVLRQRIGDGCASATGALRAPDGLSR
jgi:hypothetical protein